MDYGFAHHGTIYTPNGSTVDPAENDARNAAIESAELDHWAMRPDTMTAYYTFGKGITAQDLMVTHSPRYFNHDCIVTTWTGRKLGQIVSAKVYRHNFGGRFVSLRVFGTNGAEYYGRASYDWGSVIRLRRVK